MLPGEHIGFYLVIYDGFGYAGSYVAQMVGQFVKIAVVAAPAAVGRIVNTYPAFAVYRELGFYIAPAGSRVFFKISNNSDISL